MFYDLFKALCTEKGISPSAAALTLGINKGSVSYWKKTGKAPTSELLSKIADYFNVTTDYLLGNDNIKDNTLTAGREIDENDIRVALFGGDSEYISKEKWEEIKNFARKVAEIEKQKKNMTPNSDN